MYIQSIQFELSRVIDKRDKYYTPYLNKYWEISQSPFERETVLKTLYESP